MATSTTSCVLAREQRRVYNPTTMPLLPVQRNAKKAAIVPLAAAPLAAPEEDDDDDASSRMMAMTATPSLDSGRGTLAGMASSLSSSNSAISASTMPPSSSSSSIGDDVLDGKVRRVVDEPVNLAFQKLGYTVHTRVRLRRVSRRILHGVSGECRAGQLTAIMGPSGAGKSTLLDVLSGYTSAGVEGRVLVNGSPRDARHFRRQSVYIQQDASLHPQLTVKEAMNVAAVLKLGGRGEGVQKTIVEVLESLGLLEHANTMTSRLSGGQLKRLATALELLNNPPIMFFDEPTSGLDSSTTKQCVRVLQRLARQGRTVVCTIHQPSATVFALLDQLFLLVDGRCAYRGATANLLPYLSRLGLQCPPYHNPADYALEVAGGEYGDHADTLVRASDNGRCLLWTETASTSSSAASASTFTATTTTAPDSSLSGSCSAISQESGEGNCRAVCGASVYYPTTFWMQLFVLVKRTFLRGLRDRMLCHSRLYTHLVAGLLIGVLFLDIGGDAAHVFHNFSLLFFCLMFLMFTALSAMILAFPLEMPIVAREHFNRWYSLKSYFLAVTLADVPLQAVCTMTYTVVVYYMTSQPMEPQRFLLFLLICSLVSFVAQSLGLLIGAAMKVQHGVIFGPLAILPFTIFSGYFVHQKDAPAALRWLFHASYLKYGLSGSMLAVYGYGRAQLGCSEDYCHFRRPDKFLAELDLDGGNYWHDVAFLAVLGLVLRVVAYFVLKFRLRQFR